MRTFLPEDLSIKNWAQIETYFEDLNTRAIDSVEDLKKWMQDRSELEAVLEENMAWRYIKMNIDTTDPELQKSFQFFVQNISPNIAPYAHGLNTKLMNSKHLKDLDAAYYFIYLRDIKNAIYLYREENIPLFTELTNKAQKFGEISAQMTVQVDPNGNEPLKPFDGGEDLLDKCIACFDQIRPYYGDCIRQMKVMGHLDLVSRKGKAPGGFMYPLYETGVPFIYMNAVGLLSDAVTMVHEGGHAIHSFYTKDMELTFFKSTPSEVAELASMSMELISMEHWNVFFKDEDSCKRARKEQLQGVLATLPWVAMVDEFQHWLYENSDHTHQERHDKWATISKRYGTGLVDWTSYENYQKTAWQRQLHIYEVPFYYIEYGMAQLGAIAIWRNYKQNPEKALDDYDRALKLGYTKTISEIYETAGIKFDFSAAYVKDLANFVKCELELLDN